MIKSRKTTYLIMILGCILIIGLTALGIFLVSKGEPTKNSPEAALYNHAEDYSWITGVLIYNQDKGYWEIKCKESSRALGTYDKLPLNKMPTHKGLKDGERVIVRGQLDSSGTWLQGMVYNVANIEKMDK